MPITQEEADIIVQNIKNELFEKFGDIENINLAKARAIRDYCGKKVAIYNNQKSPVHYGYWFHLHRAYDKAVSATELADRLQD